MPATGSQSATRTVPGIIKRAADIHGVTEGSIVNAAWAVVFGKQTGTTNVVFGTAFSGRDEPIEELQAMGVGGRSLHRKGPTPSPTQSHRRAHHRRIIGPDVFALALQSSPSRYPTEARDPRTHLAYPSVTL
ncbi:hypothetical protein KJ359_003064 [Pestalotiopsis sp. 9143b]|nr:hypothetical protein KJ359_003064 [Pestalotiopsis sp. 9143b]